MTIKATMAMIWTMTGTLAASGQAVGKVLVCVNSGDYEKGLTSLVVLARAEGISSRMFKSAGVALEWLSGGFGACRKPLQTQAVILDFAINTPASQYPGALAYALPYEGIHMVVLLDRIQKKAADPEQVSPLLAHVMTHEITHLLQGVSRHSETGVMKALWDSRDFRQMAYDKPLPFAPEDIALIQRGLHLRAAGATFAVPPAATAEVR